MEDEIDSQKVVAAVEHPWRPSQVVSTAAKAIALNSRSHGGCGQAARDEDVLRS
jgi:hypothetical protein